MKLYLVRHGQTDWNLKGLAQGRVDNPLNSTGINQAEKLKEKLKSYVFDICYCSPLNRATQTAQIITDGRVKTIYDDDLMERSFGTLEGINPTEWNLSADPFDRRANTNQGGIEPIKDLLARSKRVLERIASENPPDAKVLIVAHGVLLKTMHFNIVGYDDDTDFYSFHLENGEIAEYDFHSSNTHY